MGRLRSLIVTLTIVGLILWCYFLTDAYAWGAHQVLAGILDVAGLLGIGATIYVFLRFSDDNNYHGKRQKWDEEWRKQ